MAILPYLAARLREPGTMRSLIWTILSLAGVQVTDDAMASYMLLASAGLGLVSAAMPEGSKKPTPAESLTGVIDRHREALRGGTIFDDSPRSGRQ